MTEVNFAVVLRLHFVCYGETLLKHCAHSRVWYAKEETKPLHKSNCSATSLVVILLSEKMMDLASSYFSVLVDSDCRSENPASIILVRPPINVSIHLTYALAWYAIVSLMEYMKRREFQVLLSVPPTKAESHFFVYFSYKNWRQARVMVTSG